MVERRTLLILAGVAVAAVIAVQQGFLFSALSTNAISDKSMRWFTMQEKETWQEYVEQVNNAGFDGQCRTAQPARRMRKAPSEYANQYDEAVKGLLAEQDADSDEWSDQIRQAEDRLQTVKQKFIDFEDLRERSCWEWVSQSTKQSYNLYGSVPGKLPSLKTVAERIRKGEKPPRDSDGDGVMNTEDACPDTAGEGSDGCPVSSTPQPDQSETQPVGVIGQLQAFLQGVVDAVRGVFMS